MIDYTTSTIARMEYEERVRSLAPIPDFDSPPMTDQPGWVSRQAKRLRSVLEYRLAGLGERMKRGREEAPAAPFAEHKGSEVLKGGQP